jgi:hypothetical protein
MIPPYRKGRFLWACILWCLPLGGCALKPYQYGHFHDPTAEETVPPSVVIERGAPNKTLDRIANIVGFPARILPMNSKINDHNIAPETEEKLKTYLVNNDLTDVRVFVNEYAPKDRWRRLRDNKLVSAGWRYTVGSLSVIGYTIFPGRIFGGDRYDPFTNSLDLNSDVAAVVLREAAYAKDVHYHKLPGTYAVTQELPLVGLLSDGRAVRDVIGYARDQDDWEVEQEAYHVLFPQMGAASTSLGGAFVSSVWWGGPVLGAGGAAVGHVAGRTMSKREAAKHEKPESPTEPENTDVQQAGYIESKATEEPSSEPKLFRLPPP